MPYIGNIPVPQATQTRDRFTATSGQTTFATSGYTPGFLDVYLNGVHLDASDYTATNGSDVVLDTGAATDDIVEVVAFTAFTPANIDAVSAANGGTFSGAITVDEDGATVATFDRATSDGTIVDLQKDGTTVGAIGVNSSYMYVGDINGTLGAGLHFVNGAIRPFDAKDNLASDAGIELGRPTNRFLNLYLSGGVYLGGTGAANKLDDYEEGTWTPTGVNGGTWSSIVNPTYVKIGNTVFASFQANLDSDGPGTATFGGLPFAVTNTQGGVMGIGNPNYEFLGGQINTSEQVVFRHGLDSNNRSVRLSVIYYSEA